MGLTGPLTETCPRRLETVLFSTACERLDGKMDVVISVEDRMLCEGLCLLGKNGMSRPGCTGWAFTCGLVFPPWVLGLCGCGGLAGTQTVHPDGQAWLFLPCPSFRCCLSGWFMRLISDQRGTLHPGWGAKAPITTPSAASGKPEPGSEPSFTELGILGKQAFLCLPQLKRKMENSERIRKEQK